jgi:hypothetical protein
MYLAAESAVCGVQMPLASADALIGSKAAVSRVRLVKLP